VQPAATQTATAAISGRHAATDLRNVKALNASGPAQKATQVVNFCCITMSPPLLARGRQF
jgi:hypothetical protein